jgi:CheY-like chemotaxis protein
MPALLLCVQRDRELGRVYAEALGAEGYEVLCAHDGRGALDLLERQHPSFVVLDAYLPRQDGFEILAEIRARPTSDSVPVLIATEGDVTEDIAQRATALGAIGVESSPIDAATLVARVAEHVKPSDERKSAPLSLPKEGSLQEIPFPELLRGLHLAALDGVLLLDHGRKKKAIELRDGWPASIKSNLVSECFGAYLVKQGRCSKEQLEESIKRMRTGEGLQGEILVAMDVLDEEAVVEALQTHAFEKFFEIFSWRDGRFNIRRGAHVQRGSSFGIQGHPSRLIVEGIRRQFSLKQIDRYLAMHRDDFFVSRISDQDQLEQVGLLEEEAVWLRGLDQSTSLGSLLDHSETIRRIAFGLISIELLGMERGGHDISEEAVIDQPISSEASHLVSDSGSDEELRSELAALANSMQNKDFYDVLGVSAIADDEEIQTAYKELAKQAHSDRFHGASGSVRQLAAQVMDRIEKAYAGIATGDARTEYASKLTRGRREAAVEDEGRRALQAETEYQKGEKRMATRDYEGALRHFGRAVECYPAEGEYRSHYGWCLFLCHPDNDVMLSEAMEHCREGVKLAKDREKPYLLLGRLYKATGRVGAAKKMFTRAVEIRPQCVEAMRELRIMNMRRDKDKGVLKRIFRR